MNFRSGARGSMDHTGQTDRRMVGCNSNASFCGGLHNNVDWTSSSEHASNFRTVFLCGDCMVCACLRSTQSIIDQWNTRQASTRRDNHHESQFLEGVVRPVFKA